MPRDEQNRTLPESELERKAHALEQFAFKVAHDLKSPLFAISAAVATLRRRLAGHPDETTDQLLRTMEETVADLQQRIDQVLRLSIRGLIAGERRAVPLSDVVRRVIERNRVAIDAKGAVVRIGELPTIASDPDLLLEILENLLSNSLRYGVGASPLVIEVSAEVDPEEVRILFKDNGPGFGDEYLEHPFEHHAGERPGASGVGLMLVRRAVESLGGRAWLGPGPGAAVWIALPTSAKPTPDARGAVRA